MRTFTSFIGVDLGGGKGKNTAVAHLRAVDDGEARVEVVDYGTGKEGPYWDDRLVAYLSENPDALVAIDAPLSLPGALASPPSAIVEWFRERAAANTTKLPGGKPRYTPYTQRATEVILHEEHGLTPREALGQGMGPLTARAVYLRSALPRSFVLGENLIEVYPKATIRQLFGDKLAGRYKRSASSPAARLEILRRLPTLRFAPGAWREHGLANDHKFDAILCAYTAWLFSTGACVPPPSEVVAADGWIWVPYAPATTN